MLLVGTIMVVVVENSWIYNIFWRADLLKQIRLGKSKKVKVLNGTKRVQVELGLSFTINPHNFFFVPICDYTNDTTKAKFIESCQMWLSLAPGTLFPL